MKMTTVMAKQPKPTRSRKSAAWFGGTRLGRHVMNAWRWSGHDRRFTIRKIVAAALVLAVCGVLIINLVQVKADIAASRQATADSRIQDQAIYTAQLQTYNDAVNARVLCLDSVERSLANRGQWQILVDAALDAGLDGLAEQLRDGPLLRGEPRSVEDCGPPPVLPAMPESLR